MILLKFLLGIVFFFFIFDNKIKKFVLFNIIYLFLILIFLNLIL